MAYAQYLLRRKSENIWRFRIQTPKNLRGRLPREFQKSTGARDKRDAAVIAGFFAIVFREFFEKAPNMTDDELHRKHLLLKGRLSSAKGKVLDSAFDTKVSERRLELMTEQKKMSEAKASALLGALATVGGSAPSKEQPPTVDNPQKFSTVANKWLDQFLARDVAVRGKKDARSSYEFWCDFFGDIHCHEIKRSQMREARTIVDNLPNRSKLQHLTHAEIFEMALDGDHDAGTVGLATKRARFRHLRDIFEKANYEDSMIQSFDIYLQTKGLKNKPTIERKPFSDTDLQAIFGPNYGSYPATNNQSLPVKFWGPLLLAYSGARRKEILSLRVDNIQVDEGIHFIEISDRFEGQSLKNENSRRKVPIHSSLISAGFLDFVADRRAEAGVKGKLFEWPNTDKLELFSDWFLEQAESLGVELRGENERGNEWVKTLHSLRHTAATNLDSRDSTQAEIGALLGHTTAVQVEALASPTTARYTHRKAANLSKLQKIVNNIKYDGVNIDSLSWRAFKLHNKL